MAVLEGVIIRIGSSAADASASNLAIDVAAPYVEWDLPPGFQQQRFNVRISNAEPDGWAYMTSGSIASSGRSYQFAAAIQMNENFEGLCKVEVALSQNSVGDMEWISEPLYFVYDRVLERFYRLPALTITWSVGNNPDSLPANGQRIFHVQISEDPLFSPVEFQDNSIVNTTSPIVSYPVPPDEFAPRLDRAYFYRVRQYDGLDWGPWSRVNALWNLGNVPPTVTILDVVPLNNDEGDIVISYLIEDPDDRYVQVNFNYREDGSLERFPCSLVAPAVSVPVGINQVIWRSNRDIANKLSAGVMLFARGLDAKGVGAEAFWGPFDVDNSQAPLPGGGIGATNYDFPVRLGWMVPRQQIVSFNSDPEPAQLKHLAVIQQIEGKVKQLQPMIGGWTCLHQPSLIGRLESGGDSLAGWEDDNLLVWPTLLKASWAGIQEMLPEHTAAVTFAVGRGPLNPHVTERAWLFKSPEDYATNADAWPRPYSSRDLGPTVDAWVQLVILEYTDRTPCGTCHGRSWVPSQSGPPYTRLPCPVCEDGFSSATPALRNGRSVLKAYGRPHWIRLSDLTGGRYRPGDRFGVATVTPSPLFATQHIVGRHLSDLETAPGKPKLWPMASDVSVKSVTRQPGDGGNVEAWSQPLTGEMITQPPQSHPTIATIHTTSIADNGPPLPVDGEHGPLKQNFFWGRSPDENPLMTHRPRPTQVWDVKVSGSIGRIFDAVPMRFRFLQPFWNSYNTIHWQATGSDSSLYHVQVSRQIDANQMSPWVDAIGDNTFWDNRVKAHLVPALTFWMYWETRSRDLFPEGGSFRLRMRQYDDRTRTFSNWVYSNVFQIFDEVPNPVSVLSLQYEPWSKQVEIKLRVDDVNGHRYNLTRFWYSNDDGVTWREINSGDIAGPVRGLDSTDINQANVHTIWWNTRGLNFQPSNTYRVRIESIPAHYHERLTLPFLRFYGVPNPVTDPAMAEMQSILGRRDQFAWSDEEGKWVPLGEPQITPGQLDLVEMERERVRRNASPVAPSGWYSLVDESGVVIDQESYNTWLKEAYYGTESNGQALSRLNRLYDDMVNVDLPKAQDAIFQGELYCRKRLIDQGYFAEAYFPTNGGVIEETITVPAAGNRYTSVAPDTPPPGEDPLTTDINVTRYWRYRVQVLPEGPEGIYNPDGYLDPAEFTSLETVYFKAQLDRQPSFDSQPFAKPLREFLFDHDGKRLSVARYEPGTAAMHSSANLFLDGTRVDAGRPWDGKASDRDEDQFSSTSPATTDRVVTMGGTLKIKPEDLPGQRDGDDLAGGESWEGEYTWRIAAYNAFVGPVEARPRPLITQVSPQTAQDSILVTFKAQAHPKVTQMSLNAWTDVYGRQHINGYEVSRQVKTPTWEDEAQIECVSDRRAPFNAQSGTVNGFRWVPAGTSRTRPTILYSDRLMQYVMAWSKPGFSNQPRIVTARAMRLPVATEYECLWERPASQRPETGMYGPWLIEEQDRFALYLTVQQGTTPTLARSLSRFADEWGEPVALGGVASGANPCVVVDNGTYHLFYEKLDTGSGKVKVYYATSTDGLSFTPANGGSPVFAGAGDVGSPAVVRVGDAWVMYFTDHATGMIASVVSADGLAWSSYQVERAESAHGTPMHPCPFVDRFKGNEELFLAYNYVAGNGEASVHYVRREDRVWIEGETNRIFAAPFHLLSVPSSQAGVTRQCAISMSAHGVQPGDSVRVRLRFDAFAPTTAEYHRQSEWVDAGSMTRYHGYLNPLPWYYDETLLNLPYLSIGGAA